LNRTRGLSRYILAILRPRRNGLWNAWRCRTWSSFH